MSKTLEQKNTRYLLIWLPVVLLLGSLLFFVMLSMHAHHTQQKLLELKQQNVWKAFSSDSMEMLLQIRGEYAIEENTPESKLPVEKLTDTSLLYSGNAEAVNFKFLTRKYTHRGKEYLLTTYVSSNEFSHLTVKVFVTELLVFLLLLFAIVYINRKSSRLLWKPFYHTMKTTNEYDVVRNPSFHLSKETGITEFNELNNELSTLIHNVNLAYNNQKDFVENASHEIQTPLAIIRSKLDLLINEPGLTEKSATLLGDITEANDRLSQMNKSLLLLAKIDNNQFPEQEKICVSTLLNKILNTYQEHYDDFPTLTSSIESGVYMVANAALGEILFSNLIKNAVVHNVPGGFIKISLSKTGFTIENTGQMISEDPQLFFERFKKGTGDAKTTGLGLALVKQISQLYQMPLTYRYEKGIHTISLDFQGV